VDEVRYARWRDNEVWTDRARALLYLDETAPQSRVRGADPLTSSLGHVQRVKTLHYTLHIGHGLAKHR
jgi:hypothetical protein